MPKPCIVLAPTACGSTCTLPVMTLITCNTKTCWFKVNFSMYILLLVISTYSMALQNLSVMKLEKHGITDVSSTFGYIHHWKIPLFLCIFNICVTLDKWKPYRSFLVIPEKISNENRWVVVTSLRHEPLAIVTSYWPIILTRFLWTLSSQWHCQPGTFQPCGSSLLHLA